MPLLRDHQSIRDSASAQLNAEGVVVARLGPLQGDIASLPGNIRRERFAAQPLLRCAYAPRSSRQSTNRYACRTNDLSVDLQRHGRRGERKGVGFAVADFVIGRG